MKFSIERLYEIAKEEYTAADFLPGGTNFYTWKEGVGNWAYYSAQQEYESEEEVREEIRGYIVEEKENMNN